MEISFTPNGDMIASPETGGAVYIGRVDSTGDLWLVPGILEISEDEVIEKMIASMNDDPEIQGQVWNIAFTKAAVKAGEKARVPEAYLRQARVEEYRGPSMTEWRNALRDAEIRDECHDADGNLTARFWTHGFMIWATPGNIVETNARQIRYRFESGAGYIPEDL